VDGCFEHFAAGAGRSALLRVDAGHLRTMIGERFDPAWDEALSTRTTPIGEVRATYDAWVGRLARDIDVPSAAGPAGR
jgi:hypothetical protein